MNTINREISWLHFNERLLQEAENQDVPLLERVFFLGIFSNNLDEFFGVRVATLRRLAAAKLNASQLFAHSTKSTLAEIKEHVVRQLKRFNTIYLALMQELEDAGIDLINEKEYNEDQKEFVRHFFEDKVRSELIPIMLSESRKIPFIKHNAIYFGVRLFNSVKKNKRFALIEIPTEVLPRFIVLPGNGDKTYITMLDDIIRAHLADIFSIFKFESVEGYNFKLTRDSELDLDEDISKSLTQKIGKSLKQRKKGQPVRFNYDQLMPDDLLQFLIEKIGLKPEHNLIPGRRYHNFKDFMRFPVVGKSDLCYDPLEPLEHPDLKDQASILKVIAKKDILLAYPYQDFNYIVEMLRQAALDPKVKSIKINVYRLAHDSKIGNALISAVKNGKSVTVLVELQARFDEANNMRWANKLQDEGVKIIFGIDGLKVHSKLLLIKRKENNELKYYAHIGTGNFHEKTAKIYADYSLLTADKKLTTEVEKVFEFFNQPYQREIFKHLWVSPFNTRRKLVQHIKAEIKNAALEKEAYIILKLNNLVDVQIITLLCEASNAGVKITLLIRGICCLVPGVEGVSENIEVRGVIDRFLEHARVFIFANDGNEKIFISSADLMPRNLDKRVEVTTPIYDTHVQKILKDNINIMLADNVKARVMTKDTINEFYGANEKVKHRSQYELYAYFKNLL